MMGWWAELLPLFAVRWLAVRWCERMTIGGGGAELVTARPDVLFRVRGPAAAAAADSKK